MKSYVAMINNFNHPGCDGAHCKSNAPAELRVLPIAGSGNLILCRSCYNHETAYRKDRNKDLEPWAKFNIPKWDELKIYE